MGTVLRWSALIFVIVATANFLLPLTGIPMPYYSCGPTDSGFVKCRVLWN